MEEPLASFVEKYRHKGILVDTNLLLLWLVGLVDLKLIAKFSRAKGRYTADDHAQLVQFLGEFRKVVSIPHILTEISNLVGEFDDIRRIAFFAQLETTLSILVEEFAPATQIANLNREAFIRFGITDAAIFGIAKEKYLVLTDDLRLAGYLQKYGFDVINFNHIRFGDLS